MNELMLSLLAWVAAETGLVAPPPPPVAFVPQQTLNRLSGDAVSGPIHVRALYHLREGAIYLRDDWDAAELNHRAALLHELVHHVQLRNGIRMPCAAALEKEAYRLTFLWLEQRGVADPYAALNTDPLTIAFLSMCPEAD